MRDYDREIERSWRSLSAREQREQATKAAHKLTYEGEMTDPPAGIVVGRWRAMINQVLINGEPK